MTQKELLYLEDAYKHECNIIGVCYFMIEELDDEDLKSFIEKEVKKHITMKDKILRLMEDKSDE